VRASRAETSQLSLETVQAIVKEGRDLGYRKLHITGGEPLLWKGLLEVLSYAESLEYKSIFLNTNGTLIDQESARQLASFKNLKISISLEGREPLHDSIRGAGSYRQAITGIQHALHAGVPLCIFTTLRKRLLPYLSHYIDEVYERFPNIENVTLIQLIRVKDDAFDLSDELITPDDFINVVQGASLLNLYGHKSAVLNNPLVNAASKKMGIWGIPLSAPLRPDGDLIILADKSIACAHSSGERIGKYIPGVMAKILSLTGYRAAVAPDETTCPKCTHFSLCRENGMQQPSGTSRDMNTDKPFCKRVLNAIPFSIRQTA
jgi:MoaA/NifB/PqqE/SkfB family radical SAM enzyme